MAQRQFRSDDTSTWAEKYGSGSDSSLTISADTTEAPIDSGCTGTGGASTLAATNGSFAAGQLILIHQSRGTGAGQWELNKIASYAAGTITLAYTLINSYASGAQVRVLKQYSAVTIDATRTYTAKGWDGTVGGILAFVCNGAVTINGTIKAQGNDSITSNNINAAGGGFRGGGGITNSQAIQGEGESGVGGGSRSANGLGGGGGQQGNGNGSGGLGNQTVADLTTKFLFGGGGGGNNSNNGQPAARNGANGGGLILIIGSSITVNTGGAINARGGKGLVSTSGQGPAGSGGGGQILLKGDAIVLGTNLALASGQTADTQTLFGDPGGAGGGSAVGGTGSANIGGTGRIHADYGSSISGSTTPTLDSRQDSSLVGSLLKNINELARASVKSVQGLAIASVKNVNGLA